MDFAPKSNTLVLNEHKSKALSANQEKALVSYEFQDKIIPINELGNKKMLRSKFKIGPELGIQMKIFNKEFEKFVDLETDDEVENKAQLKIVTYAKESTKVMQEVPKEEIEENDDAMLSIDINDSQHNMDLSLEDEEESTLSPCTRKFSKPPPYKIPKEKILAMPVLRKCLKFNLPFGRKLTKGKLLEIIYLDMMEKLE